MQVCDHTDLCDMPRVVFRDCWLPEDSSTHTSVLPSHHSPRLIYRGDSTVDCRLHLLLWTVPTSPIRRCLGHFCGG
jgi:hypothetical protein